MPCPDPVLGQTPHAPLQQQHEGYLFGPGLHRGFAEWLAMHSTLLPMVAPIVTSALKDPELALCASMALKDICRDCAEAMKPQASLFY